MHGIIEYNEDGLVKCEICGQFFKRPLTHVRQKHFLEEREYKQQFGFDLKKGICSKESSAISREKIFANYDRCIKRNLAKGEKHRFKKGDKGRTKDKVSAQTRNRLKDRLKDPYMIKAMQESGRKVGKSGLGNKKRWHKNEN
jgi:hypothetical protein